MNENSPVGRDGDIISVAGRLRVQLLPMSLLLNLLFELCSSLFLDFLNCFGLIDRFLDISDRLIGCLLDSLINLRLLIISSLVG